VILSNDHIGLSQQPTVYQVYAMRLSHSVHLVHCRLLRLVTYIEEWSGWGCLSLNHQRAIITENLTKPSICV